MRLAPWGRDAAHIVGRPVLGANGSSYQTYLVVLLSDRYFGGGVSARLKERLTNVRTRPARLLPLFQGAHFGVNYCPGWVPAY